MVSLCLWFIYRKIMTGRFSVIDGQQRLTSFFNFIDGRFKLSSLNVFDELNGKKI